MLFLYAIFFFLVLRFSVTLFNFISNPKLTPSPKHYSELVSIIVITENENDDLLTLLQSIHVQEYTNFEVLMIRASVLAESPYRDDPRFKIMDLPELPAGWTFKNFSYYYLSNHARGKYLIFLDPRSIAANGLINNAVHRMKIQQLTFLSLFGNQIMLTIGERLVVPLVNYLLLNLVPLRVIRLFKSPVFSVCSGQFMMFDAENYRQHNWHGLVRNKISGNVEMMRQIKAYGYHAEVLLANGFLYCRLYSGFTSAVRTLSKSIIGDFGNISALFIYIFLVIIGPVAITMFMGAELFLFAVTLIVLSRIMISLASGQNAWFNVVLHPLQMMSLILIFALSVPKHFTRSIIWKQRNAPN